MLRSVLRSLAGVRRHRDRHARCDGTVRSSRRVMTITRGGRSVHIPACMRRPERVIRQRLVRPPERACACRRRRGHVDRERRARDICLREVVVRRVRGALSVACAVRIVSGCGLCVALHDACGVVRVWIRCVRWGVVGYVVCAWVVRLHGLRWAQRGYG